MEHLQSFESGCDRLPGQVQDRQAEMRPHTSPYHFRRPGISGARRQQNCLHTGSLGSTQDGTQITRVADLVKHQEQAWLLGQGQAGDIENGQDALAVFCIGQARKKAGLKQDLLFCPVCLRQFRGP